MEDYSLETDDPDTKTLEDVRGMEHDEFILWLQRVKIANKKWVNNKHLEPLIKLQITGADFLEWDSDMFQKAFQDWTQPWNQYNNAHLWHFKKKLLKLDLEGVLNSPQPFVDKEIEGLYIPSLLNQSGEYIHM
jgi:hypothetical protein